MVDKIKDWAVDIRDFLQSGVIAWFVFGLGLGLGAWWVTHKRADKEELRADEYEAKFNQCLELQAEIRSKAEQDAIKTIQTNMQSIMQISDIIKASNEMQETYIEQRKKRTQENKSLIKEIEKIKNENS